MNSQSRNQPENQTESLNLNALKDKCLKPRDKQAHKGDFGHVLIVGGDYGMAGSVRMASEAAYRVGAGLVSVATHLEHVDVVNVACPEVMCHAVEEIAALEPLLNKATVIAVGMGLGQNEWGKRLLEAILKTDKPCVVDADALNNLGQSLKRDNWILTPHPGEAGRLLGVDTQTVQADRVKAICELQASWGGVVVLKGAGTLVKGEDEPIGLCEAGNPGMASGGMGDVLSGVIAGLVAQGLSLRNAASLGVCLHATAGDLASAETGQRGLLATDLLPYLRELVQ